MTHASWKYCFFIPFDIDTYDIMVTDLGSIVCGYINPLPTMTHICVMSSHKPIRICMGGLILGVNTLYRLFCIFKLFTIVGKGLNKE